MKSSEQTDSNRQDSDYRTLRSSRPADHWVERARDEQRQEQEKAS